MSEPVKTRRYDSSRRRAAARQTRRAILDAATRLFLDQGYPGTTMAAIAAEAGVAVDTIYATIGTKPQLFRLLVESAISGVDEAVPALQRDYVTAMREEPDAARKLAIYAGAVRHINARLAPLFGVLQGAAAADDELAALWREISERRARNMRLLAADLVGTDKVRPDLSLDDVADIVWTMNSPEFYILLVQERGWDGARFEAFLADTWRRLLLSP